MSLREGQMTTERKTLTEGSKWNVDAKTIITKITGTSKTRFMKNKKNF